MSKTFFPFASESYLLRKSNEANSKKLAAEGFVFTTQRETTPYQQDIPPAVQAAEQSDDEYFFKKESVNA